MNYTNKSCFIWQIHKILSNTPAAKDGRLKKGDRILAVNGMSMRGLTHRESITVLKVSSETLQ